MEEEFVSIVLFAEAFSFLFREIIVYRFNRCIELMHCPVRIYGVFYFNSNTDEKAYNSINADFGG
jgi:hypothetical protein